MESIDTQAELAALIDQNEGAFLALASGYEALLGGVPTIESFGHLLETIAETNYGRPDYQGIVFNTENVFINVASTLIRENVPAAIALTGIVQGDTLPEEIESLYDAVIGADNVYAEAGKAYLTRPDALDYYQQVADERGTYALIVALGVVLQNAVAADTPGLGDTMNSLLAAIRDGSADLPASGTVLTPGEVADGVNFDNDSAVITVGFADATHGGLFS